VVFIDSNIPMYLVGAPHPHKADAQRLLEKCIVQGQRLVSDAEVLQEILHRYAAIGRSDAVQPAFAALLEVADEVFPIERLDVEKAKDVLLASRGLSARDALHVAIMRRYSISEILTFDTGFDACAGIKRLA
jgi:predicted nucleic acid-binding protein